MTKEWDWIDYDDTPTDQIEPLHEMRHQDIFDKIVESMKNNGCI